MSEKEEKVLDINGSKSISNRVTLLTTLSSNPCTIKNF